MRRNCWLRFLWQSVICFMLFLPSYSQSIVTTYTPYQALPTAPLLAHNDSGTFLWPITVSVQSFTVGSVMNISWETKFSRVNIWAVPNFDWNSPIGLISNTPASFFEWTVECGEKCSVPWLIRAVNAEGDYEEQQGGGFVSAEFWIRASDSTSTSTSLASTSKTSTSSTASSVPPTSSSVSTSRSSSYSTTTTTPASQRSSSSLSSAHMSNNASIGIGAGVGVGVVATAVGWFLLWRHYRRKQSPPSASDEQNYSNDARQTLTKLSIENPTKGEGRSELATKSPKYYEAPGWNQEPQELYAGTPTQYHPRSGHRFAK